MFWIKQLLYKIGRCLIRVNYVPSDGDLLVIHDLRLQIQELRQELARVKQSKILERFR